MVTSILEEKSPCMFHGDILAHDGDLVCPIYLDTGGKNPELWKCEDSEEKWRVFVGPMGIGQYSLIRGPAMAFAQEFGVYGASNGRLKKIVFATRVARGDLPRSVDELVNDIEVVAGRVGGLTQHIYYRIMHAEDGEIRRGAFRAAGDYDPEKLELKGRVEITEDERMLWYKLGSVKETVDISGAMWNKVARTA